MPIIDNISISSSQLIVWEINEALHDLILQTNEAKLDVGATDGFQSELRKKQWIAVRLACYKLYPNKSINYNKHGKPSLEDINLSITHSHNYIAISTNAQADTGVDLQLIDDKILRVYHKFVNETEDSWVKKDLIKSTIVWSVKEAMYKLYGDCSPYFKSDYCVREVNEKYVCEMNYGATVIERQVVVKITDTYIIALVND